MNFGSSSIHYQNMDMTYVQNQSLQVQQNQVFGPQGFDTQGFGQPGFHPQSFMGAQIGFRPHSSLIDSWTGFNTPSGSFSSPNNFSQQQKIISSQQIGVAFGGRWNQQSLNSKCSGCVPQQTLSAQRHRPNPSRYAHLVTVRCQKDNFQAVDKKASTAPILIECDRNKLTRPPPVRHHPYKGPQFLEKSAIKTGRFAASSDRAGRQGFKQWSGKLRPELCRASGPSLTSNIYSSARLPVPSGPSLNELKEGPNPKAACSVLAADNIYLGKFKNLAEQIKQLKKKRPNAVDTIHSAANIARISIQVDIEQGPFIRGVGTFFCLAQFDGVNVAICCGQNKRNAKNETFNLALQKLMKPYQRMVLIDGKIIEFQASECEFSCEPPQQTVIKPTAIMVAKLMSSDFEDSVTDATEMMYDGTKECMTSEPDFSCERPKEAMIKPASPETDSTKESDSKPLPPLTDDHDYQPKSIGKELVVNSIPVTSLITKVTGASNDSEAELIENESVSPGMTNSKTLAKSI